MSIMLELCFQFTECAPAPQIFCLDFFLSMRCPFNKYAFTSARSAILNEVRVSTSNRLTEKNVIVLGSIALTNRFGSQPFHIQLQLFFILFQVIARLENPI